MTTLQNKNCKRQSKSYKSYYINRFIGMKMASDMLQMGLYPNAKEITESFACFEAALNYLPYDSTDNITAICIGDGHTPRTAAMFAFRTKWNCISIDPEMKKINYNIQRLQTKRAYIEDVVLEFDHPVVIIQCHSHAKLSDCLANISAPVRSVVAMPCCVKQYCDIDPITEYEDEWVWSPCNRIKIWFDI